MTVAGSPESSKLRASSSLTSDRSFTGTNDRRACSRIAGCAKESCSILVQFGHHGAVNWIQSN